VLYQGEASLRGRLRRHEILHIPNLAPPEVCSIHVLQLFFNKIYIDLLLVWQLQIDKLDAPVPSATHFAPWSKVDCTKNGTVPSSSVQIPACDVVLATTDLIAGDWSELSQIPWSIIALEEPTSLNVFPSLSNAPGTTIKEKPNRSRLFWRLLNQFLVTPPLGSPFRVILTREPEPPTVPAVCFSTSILESILDCC
jgi:hypothetical protein